MRLLPLALLLALGTAPAAAQPLDRSLERAPVPVPPGNTGFGAVLALAGDTLAVGAPLATRGTSFLVGATHLLRRAPGVAGWWSEAVVAPPELAAFDQFGGVLAADGDTVAVGVPRARSNGLLQSGAVYLFRRDAAGLWIQTARLDDPAVGILGRFGASLALAGDRLAVGATGADSNGLVALYERDGAGAWTRTATVRDSDAGDGGSFESFGTAVALSGDLLLVGAATADVSFFSESDGAAYLFRRDPTDASRWTFLQRLTAAEATSCPGGLTLAELSLQPVEVRAEAERCAEEDSATDGDSFGAALAFGPDRILVGAPQAEAPDGTPSAGAAYLFVPDGAGGWRQEAKLTPPEPASRGGFASALTLFGDRLLIGASGTPAAGLAGQGLAWLFAPDGGGWSAAEALRAADGLGEGGFGAAFAVDGENALVGAPATTGDAGAIYGYPPPPPPDAPPPPPPFVATATLADGAAVVSAEGAVLGAVAGTLAAPLPVALRRTETPPEPLPPGSLPLGDFHAIAAASETIAPEEQPFLVGLPVPPGSGPAALAALVLAAPDPASAARAWVVSEGAHDAANGLFVVTLSGLEPAGVTLVLTSLPASAAAGPAAARATSADLFKLRCDDAKVTPADCATVTPVVRDALADAYTVFVTEQGFKEPSLRRHRGLFEGTPLAPRLERETAFGNVLITSYPVYTIHQGRRHAAQAVYNRQTRSITIGVGPPATQAELDEIPDNVRHELFHAVQHAYDWKLPFNGGRSEALTSWFIEGTAAAAERSGAAMARNPDRIVRPIDVPLTDVTFDYGTQDFWVHAGLDQGAALSYLEPMLQHGLTPQRVADRLPLASQWWDWVKSQVMETEHAIYGDGLPACSVRDHDITHRYLPIQYPYLDHRITLFEPVASLSWPAQRAFTSPSGLPPLTAQVVRVDVAAPMSRTLVSVRRLGSDAPVTYKVYVDGEGEILDGKPKCRAIPDGCRSFAPGEPTETVAAGRTIYVVVANDAVDPAAPVFGYEVSVQPSEGLCRAP